MATKASLMMIVSLFHQFLVYFGVMFLLIFDQILDICHVIKEGIFVPWVTFALGKKIPVKRVLPKT